MVACWSRATDNDPARGGNDSVMTMATMGNYPELLSTALDFARRQQRRSSHWRQRLARYSDDPMPRGRCQDRNPNTGGDVEIDTTMAMHR
jgi:hypothetical protein